MLLLDFIAWGDWISFFVLLWLLLTEVFEPTPARAGILVMLLVAGLLLFGIVFGKDYKKEEKNDIPKK